MTRDELQHLHDRYKQTGRYSHLLALANGVHRFLEQDDPTVEIAYLKAKVAELLAEVDNARRELGDVHVSLYSEIAMLTARAEAAEQTIQRTQGRRPPMSHDDIRAALVRDHQHGGRFPADPELQHKAAEWLAELLAENERLTTAVQQCADTLAHHECEAAEIQRLTDELDRLRLSDDYMPEGVDIVMAKLRDHKRRAESAEQWKTEALPVIDGLQELGAALGIPLGKRITGPDALAAVKALTERAEAAEATVRRVRRLAESWATQPTDYDEDTEQQIEDGRAILRALDGGEQ